MRQTDFLFILYAFSANLVVSFLVFKRAFFGLLKDLIISNSIAIGMQFAFLKLDIGRNKCLCVVRLDNGLTLLFDIWLTVMPFSNEHTLTTSRRIGLRNTFAPKQFRQNVPSKSADTAECQLLHYLFDFATNQQLTGTVIAFPYLPNPNMKGRDRRDQGDSDNSEERDGPPAKYPPYADYSERFQTFKGWPHQRPTAQTLSTAGFFYTGQGDLVRCFHCGIGFKDIIPDVDPLRVHAKYSPECNFLRQLTGEEAPQHILYSSDYVELYKLQKKKKGRSTKYQTMETRVNSFNGWESRANANIQDFANAGFYYTGIQDLVRCFECDGCLSEWNAGDDPWIEHCRLFPNCPYAIEIKGSDFIRQVQEAERNFNSDPNYNPQRNGGGLTGYQNRYRHLEYREFETRLTTFTHWPSRMTQTPMQLADAGLFYTGVAKPSLHDILDLIDIVKDNRQQQTKPSANETLMDTNRRLKGYIFCMTCQKNNINAMFLPCCHHKLCMSCAQPLESCPVCGRQIKETIRTYM